MLKQTFQLSQHILNKNRRRKRRRRIVFNLDAKNFQTFAGALLLSLTGYIVLNHLHRIKKSFIKNVELCFNRYSPRKPYVMLMWLAKRERERETERERERKKSLPLISLKKKLYYEHKVQRKCKMFNSYSAGCELRFGFLRNSKSE
jgi:hypothetical protein